MAAIMSQVFSNRFPVLSIADIRQVMQNTEATMLPSPRHPDNLDHLRGNGGSPGDESDSDVSVGQEHDDQSEQNENSSAPSPGSSSAGHRSKRASVDFSEETSNDSRFNRLSSPATSELPPILRPSPTRLHEEFIRSSQIYAEELMRQQMSIVAASQKISVFPKLAAAAAAASDKIGGAFRPHNTDFRGIHNHLNAISQITQNLNHDMYKQLTSPSLTSTDSSQSPPMHPHHHLINNNLNDQNLKFSIDNILKADFGRRITEPLKRKSAKKRRASPVDLSREEKEESSSQKSSSPPAGSGNANSATASSSTESSSGGPMVWPAWVYCTRYSDRPSSGKFFFNFFFFCV